MPRKQILILIGCAVSCFMIIGTLYSLSPLSRDIPRSSFNRTILPESSVKMHGVTELKDKNYYLAGYAKSNVFLGNYLDPFLPVVTNIDLDSLKEVHVNIEVDKSTDLRRFTLAIDSPYFFLSHGTIPEIFRGKLGQWRAERFTSSMEYFDGISNMSPSSFVVRTYSRSKEGYELAKKNANNRFVFNYDLLQKQLDGLFCVDGQLHYSKTLNSMVYLYFYRNEFIVADSNLQLKYRGHTIDTFSRARVKVSKINTKNDLMLAAPPVFVNILSCVSGDRLYINSNVLSKNEKMDDFKNSSVIDVYDLNVGAYKYSFYLPHYKHYRPSNFQVIGRFVIVIYDKFLVSFEIDDLVLSKTIATK